MKHERQGDLVDVFKDVDHGNYDFTINGKCSGCGACCSNKLHLSNKEILEIKYYIKANHIQEHSQILNVLATKPMIDMTCPFMTSDSNNRCSIYEARPEICRIYKCDSELLDGDLFKRLEFISNREVIDVRETFFGRK